MAKSFYGIIGYPLLMSFSPGYFNERFREAHVDAEYFRFPLETIDELPALLKAQPELHGLNVTIPYKTAVIPFMDALSDDAKAVGAVNCITINDGKLTGYNTDWTGFRDSLKPLLQPQHKRALILGNGGAAKAVRNALRQMGIEYDVVSRGGENGPYLSYKSLTPEKMQDYYLIINTTPLGMHPDEDRAPGLPYASFTSKHLLYDLIYKPAETKFLRLGNAHGAVVKNGLEMLHLQAEANWNIWGL